MENRNDEFKKFEIELKSLMKGYITDYNDIVYILCYLSLIDCKLSNSPYINFEKEYVDITNGSLESFLNAVEKRMFSFNYNPYEKNVRNALNFLSEFRFSNIDCKALLDLLKSKDIYFYEKALISNEFGKGNVNYPSRNESTPNELVEIFKYFKKGTNLLDIGCGNGNVLVGLTYRSDVKNKVSGIEINPRNAFISELRMSLCDTQYNIISGDYLTSHIDNKYSYITINMPFNMHIPSMKRNELNIYNRDYAFDWNITPATSSEWIYINKALNLLTDDGIAVMVTTQTPLFKTGDLRFRKDFIDNNLIEYVIDMPAGTYPNTMIPYCLIVFNKNKNSDTIKFINASECYIPQRINRKVDVEKLLELLKRKEYKEVSNNEVADNEYNLLATRYIDLENKPKLKNAINLNDLNVEVIRGFQTYTGKDSTDNGKYSIITITDIDENGNISDKLERFDTNKDISKYLLKKDDVLISTRGTRIRTCIIEKLENENTIYHGNLTMIRSNDERLNPVYLKLYLDSERGQLELKSIQTGGAGMMINTSLLSKIEIPLISREEQDKIVSDYLFKKSEIDLLTSRLNELKNNMNDSVNQVFEGVKD